MHHGFGGPPWHGGGGRRGGWFMPLTWGFLQPSLLLLLAEGPQHGYSLMEELGRRKLLSGGVDVGNLYRTLHKMEMAGLVEGVRSEPGPGPKRNVYRITPQGKELLQHWAGALEQRTQMINTFLDEFHRVFGADAGIGPDSDSEDVDLL